MRKLRLYGGRPVSFASGKAEGERLPAAAVASKTNENLVVETPKTAEVIPEAHEAQAEASEALGEGWEELDEMEAKLAAELGIPLEELEDFLDSDIETQVQNAEDYDIM